MKELVSKMNFSTPEKEDDDTGFEDDLSDDVEDGDEDEDGFYEENESKI